MTQPDRAPSTDTCGHLHGANIAETRCFDEPDEIRTFPGGKLELVTLGEFTIARAIFEPGWRWLTDVQPLMNTRSCLVPYLQFHVKGVVHVVMDDGTEFDCHPGEVSWLSEVQVAA